MSKINLLVLFVLVLRETLVLHVFWLIYFLVLMLIWLRHDEQYSVDLIFFLSRAYFDTQINAFLFALYLPRA